MQQKETYVGEKRPTYVKRGPIYSAPQGQVDATTRENKLDSTEKPCCPAPNPVVLLQKTHKKDLHV